MNNGFHNKVTTPLFIDSPPTGLPPVTVTNPVLYGYSIGNSGMLQYSRGPNNAVPSPLTTLQAPAAGIPFGIGVAADVIDFAGMPGVLAMLYYGSATAVAGVLRMGFSEVVWNGAIISVNNYGTGGIVAQVAGTKLQLKNNSALDLSPLVWTLQFFRIS